MLSSISGKQTARQTGKRASMRKDGQPHTELDSQELSKMLNEDEMRDAVLLVFANKQAAVSENASERV